MGGFPITKGSNRIELTKKSSKSVVPSNGMGERQEKLDISVSPEDILEACCKAGIVA